MFMPEASLGQILTKKSLNELDISSLSNFFTTISFKSTLLTSRFASSNNTIYCFPCLSDVIFCTFKLFMIMFSLTLSNEVSKLISVCFKLN